MFPRTNPVSMGENTTVSSDPPGGGTDQSRVRDLWRRFVVWLAGVNMWLIIGSGFVLGLAADHYGYHSVDWLFFFGGGVLPIVLMTVSTDEQDPVDISNRERATFVASMLAWSVTPWGLLTQALQIGGNFLPYLRYRGKLPNRERHVPDTTVAPPFDGEWDVVNGGVTEDTSHSWGIVSQRYAYDFVVTEDGSTHRGDGDDLTDYYAFGEPIRAPADGTVVKTHDRLRDYPNPGSSRAEWRTWRITGNYVIIEHDDGEYSMLAHLQENSVTVEPGDVVARGDVVGRCGNSGTSSEPHLHFQLMDRANFWTAAGLVPRFVDVTVDRDDGRDIDPDVYGDHGKDDFEGNDAERTDSTAGDAGQYLVRGDDIAARDG
jgi:murein DD-endopeptidase MepM/ murein hydrolase activator NlpD